MLHPLFLLLLFLASVMPTCFGRPSHAHLPANDDSEDMRTKALQKLLQFFGIEGLPQSPHHIREPPQYMLDLYNTVAGDDGITKNPDVLKGNTVRSFLDKTQSDQLQFLFILSSVAKTEKVLMAELHLFKLRTHIADGLLRRHHFCQVSIYQILDKENLDSSEGKKLLSVRLLSIQSSGWEVFMITQAVHDWTEEESSNQGLLVTVQGLGGELLDPEAVKFASGKNQHESRKPMLVLFTDDVRRAVELPTNMFLDSNQTKSIPSEQSASVQTNRTRTSRSAVRSMPCQRRPLYVDFADIGWGGWIIAPKAYKAYHCKGSCVFPLGENMRPTNHATIQSIINALKLSQDVSTPCCVPDKLFSINLLYYEDPENVVLRQYDNMVVDSCGCH